MGIKTVAKTVVIEKLMLPFMDRFFRFEKDVLKYPQAIRSGPDSSQRFDIPLEALKRVQRGEGFVNRRFPMRVMPSILRNMRKSVRSLARNPSVPHKVVSEEFLQELETFAKSLGVSHVGFAKIGPKHVFQDMAVLYDNAIVLAMEMDKDLIDKAPSYETMVMIMETYDNLGIAANKIAHYLRKQGFGAHACHPLGGMALYPPLGQMSGIGFHGRHGLIITPEFGPRIRLTAVFTSIENLPYQKKNEHGWIREYCETCLQCVKKCPVNAILDTPIPRESGKMTYTDRTKCFPYFTENFGCSVCIRVCPFIEESYAQIKNAFIS
ncbi:MAG: 4Fe-4S binding protein [Candidatus Hermodarchaeia archaeon]|jgi:NAD-dependent dihydropyrimidine dehydrogenase PreA subunit